MEPAFADEPVSGRVGRGHHCGHGVAAKGTDGWVWDDNAEFQEVVGGVVGGQRE